MWNYAGACEVGKGGSVQTQRCTYYTPQRSGVSGMTAAFWSSSLMTTNVLCCVAAKGERGFKQESEQF